MITRVVKQRLRLRMVKLELVYYCTYTNSFVYQPSASPPRSVVYSEHGTGHLFTAYTAGAGNTQCDAYSQSVSQTRDMSSSEQRIADARRSRR